MYDDRWMITTSAAYVAVMALGALGISANIAKRARAGERAPGIANTLRRIGKALAYAAVLAGPPCIAFAVFVWQVERVVAEDPSEPSPLGWHWVPFAALMLFGGAFVTLTYPLVGSWRPLMIRADRELVTAGRSATP